MISAENHHLRSSDFTSLSTEGHRFAHLPDPETVGNIIFYQVALQSLETRNLLRTYPDVCDSVHLYFYANCLFHNIVDIPRSQYLCHSHKMENLPDRSSWRHEVPIHAVKRINDQKKYETEEADHSVEPPLLNSNDCSSVISKNRTPSIKDFERDEIILNDDSYTLKTGTNVRHTYKVRRRKVHLESMKMQNYDHHGKRNFACQQCNYKTDRKNNLKRHITTMHSNCNQNLECCDVIFKCKATLREHVRLLHKTGYRCKVCERNFCRKALLRRHLTVHNGQKDFRCALCDYATSHKSNLERHQKVHDRSLKSDESRSKWRTIKCLLLLQKQKKRACTRKITVENSTDIGRDGIKKCVFHSNDPSKEAPEFVSQEDDEKAIIFVSHMESNKSKEDSHVEKNDVRVKSHISNLYENVPQTESCDDNSYIPSHDLNICKTPMNDHESQTSSKIRMVSKTRQKRLCLNPYRCAECNSSFSSQRALYSHDCKGYIHISSYSVVSTFRKWIQCPTQHIISAT